MIYIWLIYTLIIQFGNGSLTRYIKLWVLQAQGMPATDFKGNRWSLDPGMHEKWPRHSRCMRNPQVYVSGKWPMNHNIKWMLIYKPSIINQQDLNMLFLRRYEFWWFISRTMIYFNNVSWFKISFSGNNNSIRGPFILVYQPMVASRHSYTEFICLPARYGTLP